MVEYEKRDEKYQKMYDQLVKRTKLCKEKIAENKVLAQKNQVIIILLLLYNYFYIAYRYIEYKIN